MNIAAKIIKLRKEKCVTQEQLAKIIGVSAPAVSKWETGQSCPDIELLAPLARYFGVTIDELLSFRPSLSTEEANQFCDAVLLVFETEGHKKGLEKCKSLLLEYPEDTYLKLRLSAISAQYALLVREEDRTEENLEEMRQYCLRLLEEIISKIDNVYWEKANCLAACYYTQTKEFEKAKACLNEIPPLNYSTDEIYPALYMASGEREKAKQYSEKNLRQYGLMVLHSFHTLLWAAWENQDIPLAECLAEKYNAMGKSLGHTDGTGFDYLIKCSLLSHDTAKAESIFCKLIEHILHLPDNTKNRYPFSAIDSFLDSKTVTKLLSTYLQIFQTEETYHCLIQSPQGQEALLSLKNIVSQREAAENEK